MKSIFQKKNDLKKSPFYSFCRLSPHSLVSDQEEANQESGVIRASIYFIGILSTPNYFNLTKQPSNQFDFIRDSPLIFLIILLHLSFHTQAHVIWSCNLKRILIRVRWNNTINWKWDVYCPRINDFKGTGIFLALKYGYWIGWIMLLNIFL